MLNQIRWKKLRWIGHVLENLSDNVARQGLFWKPRGKWTEEDLNTQSRSAKQEPRWLGLIWNDVERIEDRVDWTKGAPTPSLRRDGKEKEES